jgi:hypothetical protein
MMPGGSVRSDHSSLRRAPFFAKIIGPHPVGAGTILLRGDFGAVPFTGKARSVSSSASPYSSRVRQAIGLSVGADCG